MATLFDVISNAAASGSIAFLLWGAAICLGELFASTFEAGNTSRKFEYMAVLGCDPAQREKMTEKRKP